jgi:hypothetical protein
MKRLPDDPRRYFKIGLDAQLVSISKLRPSHRRKVGITRAQRAMDLAYKGQIGRRDPLSVKRSADGKTYEIVDGNSTYAVAKANGWKKLPVIIQKGGSVSEQLSEAVSS